LSVARPLTLLALTSLLLSWPLLIGLWGNFYLFYCNSIMFKLTWVFIHQIFDGWSLEKGIKECYRVTYLVHIFITVDGILSVGLEKADHQSDGVNAGYAALHLRLAKYDSSRLPYPDFRTKCSP
jgi:hypothetical protein